MKRIKPTPQYYVALGLSFLIFCWMSSSIVKSVLRPHIDNNANSYIILVDAVNQPFFSEVERGARQAQSMTTDPDIRKLSDFIARAANMNIRAGSHTLDEANSYSGFGKAFVAGYVNPVLGLEGGMMFLEGMFTNFETIGNRIDEKYQAVFRKYHFANGLGRLLFWALLISGVMAYFYYRNQYEQKLLNKIAHIELLSLKELEAEQIGRGQ